MDIFEYAMRMETDGERYYREMAAKSPQPGLKSILLMLADEEVKHYEILKKNRSKASELTESRLLTAAHNIFSEMKKSGKTPDLSGEQAKLYQHALEIERKSRDYYRDNADESGPGYQKQLLLILAAEEEKHIFLIEHILEFISRPKAWLENAEFTHLEEY